MNSFWKDSARQAMEPKLILVDGYNVIKNTDAFLAVQRQSLSAARDALVKQLVNRYRHTPHQVVVVFDGQGTHETQEHVQRVRLIFTCAGETADSVISRLAREATQQGKTVVVASNDWEVRESVQAAGGQAGRSPDLTAQLNRAPRLLQQRAQHRQEVLRRLQAADEEERPRHTKGNPHRPKRSAKKPKPPSPFL
jgi:predicted RNA-binding protein with PIN domain